ncbi:MAG TPA: SGNH/GDSL hydrolase family protein [Amycolatopsis sp.]|uniref:SGNH/GDSL hydrolase family protein n=1 Tax=Amycolatopsis sp. TaxID=37632 RepID=UPI002B4881C1|nr:SGNH/GDSL hydrolase family protein [Amycolatopsis sp.]HKS49672.1 SGNH/GDSL hydrolase family protein [Amycolatopsis sp.]
MANKGSGGLILLVVVASLIGFGYLKSQQGSSAEPPAPPGSETGGGTGRYVALGDSYTSSPKTGAQAGGPPGCARSDNNYPHLIAAELRPAGFADVSCSGATTANMTSAQQTKNGTNPPQLDAVNASTTLVTIGIGGNDVGFISLARECATLNPNTSPCRDRMTAGGHDQLAERIQATASKVAAVLDRIHTKAPKAKVIVVGYPTALPDGNGCWPFVPLGAGDVAYLRESEEKLNDMLAEQAKAHKAGFADTATPSKGHDMCTKSDTKWVEDLVPTSPAEALHPNAKGQRAMADAVLPLIR